MIFLIVIIIISAGIYVLADFFTKPGLKYIFKPLTTILIIALALLQQSEVSETYKYLIIVALLFSLAGDIFLMLPTDKFVQGLASFLIAHIFYITAFAHGFGPYFEISYLIPSAIYAILFLWLVLPKTGKLKLPVLIYSLVLMVFLWQASGRFFYLSDNSSIYILAGSILFVASDSVLAYDRFVKSYKFSQLAILSTYWAAQVFLALSI